MHRSHDLVCKGRCGQMPWRWCIQRGPYVCENARDWIQSLSHDPGSEYIGCTHHGGSKGMFLLTKKRMGHGQGKVSSKIFVSPCSIALVLSSENGATFLGDEIHRGVDVVTAQVRP